MASHHSVISSFYTQIKTHQSEFNDFTLSFLLSNSVYDDASCTVTLFLYCLSFKEFDSLVVCLRKLHEEDKCILDYEISWFHQVINVTLM